MFKFFKKKSHPMSQFYEHYTNEEKMVILSILFLAGICDNDEINNDKVRIEAEVKFLNNYVQILDSKAKKANEYLSKVGIENIINTIRLMDESKKYNILLLIVDMMLSDGKMNDVEGAFLSSLLSEVEVSENEFIKKIDTINAFNNL